MIRHTVMMRWQDGTTDEAVSQVLAGLNTMPDLVPGILRYEFGSDLGLGDSNFDFALVADFASLDDYEAYSSHPEHIAVIQQVIRPIVAEAQRVQYEI